MIAALLSQFWIQRLGWTLLHFLWQGTVIAAVYAMLRSLLGRSLPSQGRYALACAALLAMAAAPPLSFLLIPNGTGSWIIAAAEWRRLLPGVVVLWVLGALIFSIRLLGGWRFVARLRSTAHPAPAQWRRTLDRISERVGVKRRDGSLANAIVLLIDQRNTEQADQSFALSCTIRCSLRIRRRIVATTRKRWLNVSRTSRTRHPTPFRPRQCSSRR